MNIDSIKNGFVIDHIEAGKGMEVYNLLALDSLDCSVAIIKNATSRKMGKKDIIKIDAKIDLDMDILGYISPTATVDVIENGAKKRIPIQAIEESGKQCQEYDDRIKKDIRNTLKEEGGDGHTYSAKQQKLMIWYTYFFLNRGKPSTHIAVLSQMDDESIKNNIPPVLGRLIEAAEWMLKGDENESCTS